MPAIQGFGLAQLVRALLERGVAGVGTAFVPYLAEPDRRGGETEAVISEPADRTRQVRRAEVILDEGIVGDEDSVLQSQVHGRGRLAAAGRCEQDHLGF